jgi:hypothetical protein
LFIVQLGKVGLQLDALCEANGLCHGFRYLRHAPGDLTDVGFELAPEGTPRAAAHRVQRSERNLGRLR